MKDIIILTQGENIYNLPLNTKTFIYLAEKYHHKLGSSIPKESSIF